MLHILALPPATFFKVNALSLISDIDAKLETVVTPEMQALKHYLNLYGPSTSNSTKSPLPANVVALFECSTIYCARKVVTPATLTLSKLV